MIHQDAITLRKACLADTMMLSALSVHVWLDTYATEGVSEVIADYVHDALSPEHFDLSLKQPENQILVAEYHQALVGFISLAEKSPCPEKPSETLEIDRLYVMPRFHGQGIASMLLQASKHLYEKQGYTFFLLTTWDQNLKAIKFYEKRGLLKLRWH